MSELCAVFVTAPSVSLKNLNALFTLLKPTSSDSNYQEWVHFRSTDPSKFPPPLASDPPLQDITETNDFESFSTGDCFKFMQANEEALKDDYLTDLWLIIDEESIQTRTCLIVEKVQVDEDDPLIGGCKVMRGVPFAEVSIIFVNLMIANMGFEEFVDGYWPEGDDEDDDEDDHEREHAGTWMYKPFDEDECPMDYFTIADKTERTRVMYEGGLCKKEELMAVEKEYRVFRVQGGPKVLE